jgi:hypothetical protein
MPEPILDFPMTETLDGGRYAIVSNLFGFSVDRVDIAIGGNDPDRVQCLVSSTERPVRLADITTELHFASPGVFELAFIGSLDERGQGDAELARRARQTAVVERLPPGACLRRLVTTAVAPRVAAVLAIDVGRILLAAANGGRLLTGVRPETIWAQHGADSIRVTGLSERSERLFRAAKSICYTSAPPFERRYTAPEIVKGDPVTDRTLSFMVGVLLAEWLTGSHPFPKAFTVGDALSIAKGEHALHGVGATFHPLVEQSLRVDPAERPTLAALITSLETAQATLSAERGERLR